MSVKTEVEALQNLALYDLIPEGQPFTNARRKDALIWFGARFYPLFVLGEMPSTGRIYSCLKVTPSYEVAEMEGRVVFTTINPLDPCLNYGEILWTKKPNFGEFWCNSYPEDRELCVQFPTADDVFFYWNDQFKYGAKHMPARTRERAIFWGKVWRL